MTLPITVLMSVYNGESWASESITSVLEQTHEDFEFIIVNDGSTDSSIEFINKFALLDDRISVIDKQNTGLADSLNQGIFSAKGEWIARIDVDDICESTRLEIQYSCVRKRSESVLIGSNLVQIDESGRELRSYRYPSDHNSLKRRLLSFKPFFAHSSAFFRVEAAKKVRGYRPRIKRGQDFDLWLRLCGLGVMSCVDQALIRLRVHPDQVSHEEGGHRQIVDATVALVSYFLRREGKPDPVEGTNADFASFRTFIENQIESSGFFEYLKFVRYSKSLAHNSDTFVTLKLLTLLLTSPHHTFRYFRAKIFGESLAKKLAASLISEKSVCVE